MARAAPVTRIWCAAPLDGAPGIRRAARPATTVPGILAPSRRALNLQLLTLVGGAPLLLGAAPAEAALVQFPAGQLKNKYVLVRAGESVAESQGYVLSNPVSKTSMDCGLSEKGKAQVPLLPKLNSTLSAVRPPWGYDPSVASEQSVPGPSGFLAGESRQAVVRQTFQSLKKLGVCEEGCWIWPSIAQNAYQTAEILAALCGVGRSRIVPEYSFLDARGVGALERNFLDLVAADLARGDTSYGPTWRPPPGVDGTPNESVADVMVRGRQLLSITETQYFGDTVVIISPDSANLSVMQAAVMGMDLRNHDSLRFAPGEVRPLELSMLQRDDSPVTIPCPNPPQCRPL